jgi:hypothetical protein
MYIVEFKIKETNRTGKYAFECLDEARANQERLQRDTGLKSVKLRTVDI